MQQNTYKKKILRQMLRCKTYVMHVQTFNEDLEKGETKKMYIIVWHTLLK